MSLMLILAFLFSVGSTIGWILELIYRRFFSDVNKERKWINPGFCTGPYLPLYGFGLCLLYLITLLESRIPEISRSYILIIMTLSMTILEYITGMALKEYYKVKLWDYSNEWGNIHGVICPKFSVYWLIIGAGYYFLIHPHILDMLDWLSHNLTFSFFIGMYFGFFIIDFVKSAQLITKLREFAIENDIIVRYEALKLHIRKHMEEAKRKYYFFRPFHSNQSLHEHLKDMHDQTKSDKMM